MCVIKTTGTINEGKSIYGKYKTAILGCSKENCWIGSGAERMAIATILIKSSMPVKFQNKSIFFERLIL